MRRERKRVGITTIVVNKTRYLMTNRKVKNLARRRPSTEAQDMPNQVFLSTKLYAEIVQNLNSRSNLLVRRAPGLSEFARDCLCHFTANCYHRVTQKGFNHQPGFAGHWREKLVFDCQ